MKEIFSELIKITKEIEKVVNEKETKITYKEMFKLLGVSELLEDQFYIKLDTLPKAIQKKYLDIFIEAIKDFINQPLYSDINLNNKSDLIYLAANEGFKKNLEKIINRIQTELAPYQEKILTFLENFKSKSKVSLEKLQKVVKLDKASLLFVLEDMRETKQIYAFNGIEVILL